MERATCTETGSTLPGVDFNSLRAEITAKLRERLAVTNERLGEVLESLERAGRLRRTAAGWQRLD